MRRNRRRCWEINATGGTAGDEHDGVSASADRVSKRHRKEPPIIPATGGAAGDEQHGVSDSIDCTHSPYSLADLANHIKNFDKDPKIFDELGWCVYSDDTETLTAWFMELREGWSESMTPADATRLVKRVLEKVHNDLVCVSDLEGFLLHYGLPSYFEIDLPPEERIHDSWDFEKLMGPAFYEDLSP